MSSITDKFQSGKDKVVGAVKNINMNKIGLDNASYFESTATAKLEDVKKMLDSDSDRDKMEGMKRLIAMISKGRDASSLFPAVVKNVISKNVELKKLVYMYLVHYAELEPDSSLLAINTFQKDLGNSNQFIRASALRVMSSIRVKIIVQLIILAIEKCMKDSSAYVRKGAAHAVSKVFNVDRDHQDQLVSIISTLLADRSTLVLGSAVAAFVEVCPDRFDLIHPHFRKLCHLLADIDEWGQIIVINMLIRYGRTQFADPSKEKQKEPKAKKESRLKISEDQSESEDSEESEEESDDEYVTLDPDHRLLLDSCLPLLKSRNAGVVLAVASAFHYLAPPYEAQKVAKSIVRLIRSRREIQYIVLTNIATMASNDPAMFEPFVSDFFINPTDPVYCRTLKLEIITLLVNEHNINKVLKELKNYVGREEKEFVTAAIQAIGRCASQVPEITDRCLHGLMSLITNKSDAVVAESVVVIKQLLQMISDKDEEQQETMKDVILHLARLLETITAPRARASIVWVIGEYSHKVPRIAPDILRQLAKSFVNEDASVKLQTLNLGSKLSITNPEQTTKIYNHILNMARYDTSYDVRDRCRLFRKIMEAPTLQGRAAQLLINKKPIPSSNTQINSRKRFTLGTLSHLLCHTVPGYQPLGDFPEVPPPGDTRNEVVEVAPTKKSKSPGKSWLDEDEGSSEGYTTSEGSEGSEGEEDSEGYSEGYSSEEGEGSEEEEGEESEDDGWPKQAPAKKAPVKATKPAPVKQAPVKEAPKQPAKPAPKAVSSIEDMFNFDSNSETASAPVVQPKNAGLSLQDLFGAAPKATTNGSSPSNFYAVSFPEEKRETLLKPHLGGGLGIEYSFSRSPSMHGSTFVGINLMLKNHSEKVLNNIRMGKVTHSGELIPFSEIPTLSPGTSVDAQISVKFTSVSQTVKFEIITDRGTFNVGFEPSVAALVRSTTMSPDEFAVEEKKLTGMNESSDLVFFRNVAQDTSALTQKVLNFCAFSPVTIDNDGGRYTFAGKTQIEDTPILFSVTVLDRDSGKAKVAVSSENTVLNSRLLKALQKEIQ